MAKLSPLASTFFSGSPMFSVVFGCGVFLCLSKCSYIIDKIIDLILEYIYNEMHLAYPFTQKLLLCSPCD